MVTGIAIPYEVDNVDTDAIMPKQFLKTIQRSGLGKSIFYERRCTGREHAHAVLSIVQSWSICACPKNTVHDTRPRAAPLARWDGTWQNSWRIHTVYCA